ncbi:MAG: AMP-binding protein, partial [Alphaproteobacteria bacterium]|nr:AMP-binding protein [Alphaproteobacteria bacterium]
MGPAASQATRGYNAAVDLIERNLDAGRGEKIAIRDDAGTHSYRALAERVDRFANVLRAKGIAPEQRILVCLLDTIDFPTVFLGAIKAGVVPVAVNTLLKPADYDYMLRDSRARMLVVSEALLASFAPIIHSLTSLEFIIVSGRDAQGHALLDEQMAAVGPKARAAATTRDDACFWLYSSGSTGAPKGTVHVHSSLIQTAELYAEPVLGIREDDVVFSAAKLFFAYGLGNALT